MRGKCLLLIGFCFKCFEDVLQDNFWFPVAVDGDEETSINVSLLMILLSKDDVCSAVLVVCNVELLFGDDRSES